MHTYTQLGSLYFSVTQPNALFPSRQSLSSTCSYARDNCCFSFNFFQTFSNFNVGSTLWNLLTRLSTFPLTIFLVNPKSDIFVFNEESTCCFLCLFLSLSLSSQAEEWMVAINISCADVKGPSTQNTAPWEMSEWSKKLALESTLFVILKLSKFLRLTLIRHSSALNGFFKKLSLACWHFQPWERKSTIYDDWLIGRWSA